jgi:hypothetical protein
MSDTNTTTGELAAYGRAFDNVYKQLYAVMEGLPSAALLWKPFDESPWQGTSSTLGYILAHGASSTVYLLRRAEYAMGRCEWGAVEGDEGREEFGPANHDIAYLRARVERSQAFVHDFLARVTPADLDAERAHPKRPTTFSARGDVIHALDHLAQHLGHAELTRQLWAIHAAA